MADPIRNFRFTLDIPNLGVAEFTDATGFNATTDIIEYRTGHDKTPRKFPGVTKYGNITLKHGSTKDALDFSKWFQSYVDGSDDPNKITKVDGSITAIDYATGSPLAQWSFIQAWPVKYSAPDFNAKGNDIAIEALELCCEGLKRTM